MRRTVVGVVVLGLAAGGVVIWRQRVVDLQQDRALAVAGRALAEGDAWRAHALAGEWAGRAEGDAARAAWQAIEVQAMARLGGVGGLVKRDRVAPAVIEADEDASLLVARAAVHRGEEARVCALNEVWDGRSRRPEAWLAIKADALLLAGRLGEARELLESVDFAAGQDGGRRCRLAMAKLAEDPEGAWRVLSESLRMDPRHPETRLFRGRMLEVAGRPADAAVEFRAASLAAPGNPFFLDQLAGFHLRRGNPAAAVEIWRQGLAAGSPDFLWVKAAFWSRVAAPVEIDWSGVEDCVGPRRGLARAIALQPAGRFWDDGAGRPGEDSEWRDAQEVYWLVLFEKLRRGDDAGAWRHLRRHGLRPGSWNPALEGALGRLLSFRLNGSLAPADLSFPRLAGDPTTPAVFQQLERLADRREQPDAALAAFLGEPAAVAWLVAGAGWVEAAVLLGAGQVPASAPPTARYTLAQALRFARGPAAALALLPACVADPACQVLRGELMLATDDRDGAVAAWSGVVNDPSAAGERAAWFLGTLAIEEGRLDEVAAALAAHRESLIGRELAARAALLAGRVDEAAERYRGIADESAEARVFLARQAVAGGDLATATRLAEELAGEFPDTRAARANLLRLAELAAGSAEAKP